MSRRILVIAPHPDDEVLGAGGTIARRAAEGGEVRVVIVTKGYPPHFEAPVIERGRVEAATAHRILGVARTSYLDFPAAELDRVPARDINARLVETLGSWTPDDLFIPFNGDLHLDHQRVFLSALVASRPHGTDVPSTIYAYETLSETNWNAPYLTPGFQPNVFVDIGAHLETKLKAFEAFESQVRAFPHERSLDALRALARIRGATVHLEAAEAFVLVRQTI